MRKIVDLRLALTIILDTMLVLSQFVFQGESMGGAVCMQSLADPGAEKQETNITTFYSFPLTFMITFTEGCFENRRPISIGMQEGCWPIWRLLGSLARCHIGSCH